MLLDLQENAGEMNKSDLNHILLEMKTKILPTHIQTHTSSYDIALLVTTTHKQSGVVLYDGCS